jgi:hypothetical protein
MLIDDSPLAFTKGGFESQKKKKRIEMGGRRKKTKVVLSIALNCGEGRASESKERRDGEEGDGQG